MVFELELVEYRFKGGGPLWTLAKPGRWRRLEAAAMIGLSGAELSLSLTTERSCGNKAEPC